ncbi:hypothetical protein BMWSH_1112 [Priestia megaterium WSH-002]|uniref:Uncharacterized protein n=1 Tax=Priestia megaterium (strain WSH-002) TaxID=1006007 RepID=A0A8D4BIJ8_PRIMW|nr:hypothetical protein BMWSH_1112 [Priestia megaterium WSH-002]
MYAANKKRAFSSWKSSFFIEDIYILMPHLKTEKIIKKLHLIH